MNKGFNRHTKKTGNWLFDSTQGFRGVLPEDYNTTFSSYFERFFERRKWPRHYQSSLVLSIHPNQFLWGIVDDCLCVVKRKMYMINPVLYLILPPIHSDGDTDTERRVIEKFASYGVGTKLSEEDQAILKLDGVLEKGNAEYIYESTHVFTGGVYSRHRNCMSKVRKQQADGQLNLDNRTVLSKSEQVQLIGLTNQWKSDRLNLQGLDRFITNFNEYTSCGMVQIISLPDGSLHGYSITELTGPKQGCIPMRLHDYQKRVTTDANVVLHCLDLLSRPEGTLLNIGAGVGVKGLDEAKQHLKPVKVLQIFSYKSDVKLTREIYNGTCQ